MNLIPQIPDPRHPDMSPEAIDRRLRHLSQLYRLGMSLREVKWLGPANVSAPPVTPRPADSEPQTPGIEQSAQSVLPAPGCQ